MPSPSLESILGGSSPIIHTTDLRTSFAFVSQPATDVMVLPSPAVRMSFAPCFGYRFKSTDCLLCMRHVSQSHRKIRLFVHVLVERPNWISNQSRHASSSLA